MKRKAALASSHHLKSVLFGASWLFVRWDACCVNGIFLIFIDPGGGARFPYWAVTGQTGISQQKGPGNLSSRMLCLSEARFLFWALTNTRASVRRAATLITFSLASSVFNQYFLPTLHVRTTPAVLCDPGQSDRALGFDATDRRGLSR